VCPDTATLSALLHGDFPEVRKLPTFEEAVAVIEERIRQLAADGFPLSPIYVVARTQGLVEQYASALHVKGIPYSQNIRTRFPIGGYAPTIATSSTCVPPPPHLILSVTTDGKD